jgi:hypothetical protein
MDKVEYTDHEMLLIDPKPGTAAAAARDFGIDLSITVSNLRLTPEQRIRKLDEFRQNKARQALDFPECDRDIALLLELEAILEYQRASETQQD